MMARIGQVGDDRFLLPGQTKMLTFKSSLVAMVLASLALLNGHLQAQEPAKGLPTEPGAYFRVRDSIEMARFERTGGEPKFSPDKKYFAVVTSRGLLPFNEIESTLWVFQSGQAWGLL